MSDSLYDVVIVGGGIVGLATAYEITLRAPGLSVVVLEAEDRLAAHQSGHNSGVIHSGLYYKPNSLKARYCTEGREAMYRFCREYGIAHERCGKVVVATRNEELPVLEELKRRGQANGLRGIRLLDPAELRDHEPHVAGIAGLFVPDTGIADYPAVVRRLAELTNAAGSEVRLSTRLLSCDRRQGALTLTTSQGEVRCRFLINCAGLQSDRIAQCCGVRPDVQITPFRGEYYQLVPQRRHLVRNLIYPVPDPRFPFLGVHFTRMVHGEVEAGPNAVLALKREGYRHRDVSVRDIGQMVCYPGFWNMVKRYWKTGMAELYRSLSKQAFLRALQRLVPELRSQDIHPAGRGTRASPCPRWFAGG